VAEAFETRGGITQEDFESRRRLIALQLLERTDQFMEWDLKFNNHISELASVLIEHVRRNPKILESSSNLQDIVRDLNAKAGQGPDVSGGDVRGGDVWDDAWGIIKDMLTGEKDLVIKIITQIFKL